MNFYSKKFNYFQLNYSVIEKETLSLIWALQYFEVYVDSSVPLVVYKDHNPITFLHSVLCPNRKLMRWILLLQAYCLNIRYIKGSGNIVADALSRAHLLLSSVFILSLFYLLCLSLCVPKASLWELELLGGGVD